MTCPNCTHELEVGQNTCSYCGFILLGSSSEIWSTRGAEGGRQGLSAGQPVSSRQISTNESNGSLQNTPQRASPSFPSRSQQHDHHIPMRATRFTVNTTSPLSQTLRQEQKRAQYPLETGTEPPTPFETPVIDMDTPVSLGTLLRDGHYQLIERKSHHKWSSNAYETHWYAQDLSQGNKDVLICEMGLSGLNVIARQASLRTAMRALFSISTTIQVPVLINVFREGGRDFFVFTPLQGESLLQRLQHLEKRLSEQEVIQYCLQITEVLEALSRQSPPMVHGLINPENIQRTRSGGRWCLTDFSVVLAGDSHQYLGSFDDSALSPFTSPGLLAGEIDARLDIYSLLATAYYAITGNLPRKDGGGAFEREQLKALVSPSFGAVLMKGLHPRTNQQYLKPAGLREDLLSLRPGRDTPTTINRQEEMNNTPLRESTSWQNSSQSPLRSTMMSSPNQERIIGSGQSNPSTDIHKQAEQKKKAQDRSFSALGATGSPEPADSVVKAFSSLTVPDEMPVRNPLPQPEELPPISQGKDTLAAILWMAGILIYLLILVLLK